MICHNFIFPLQSIFHPQWTAQYSHNPNTYLYTYKTLLMLLLQPKMLFHILCIHPTPIFDRLLTLQRLLTEFTTAIFVKPNLLLAFVTHQCFPPFFLATLFQSHLTAPPPPSFDSQCQNFYNETHPAKGQMEEAMMKRPVQPTVPQTME